MKIKNLLRKTTGLLLSLSLLCSTAYTVMANDDIKVTIDGRQIAFDVPPQLINDRTMVPLRAIFEALNATVDWNDETQTITSTKDGTTIQLTINNPTMYVNGTPITLDSPACLINDRTLVPVRAISEAFKTNVDWDNSTNTVIIQSNATLTRDKIEVKVKPDAATMVFENKSQYPYTFSTIVVNDRIVSDFYDFGKEVTVNPGETKLVTCRYKAINDSTKKNDLGLNSYGYVVIYWQGEQYYMDFTVNGITTFYKGNARGPAN